jgi:excisionase family DNA binding protein
VDRMLQGSAEDYRRGENRFLGLTYRWRSEAQHLRELGADEQAVALEWAASRLEEEVARSESELLTVAEAAEASGYTEDHLRRLAREGRLPVQRNEGRRSRMKIRRGDLPVKVAKDGRRRRDRVDYDPGEDARDIARHLRR